MSTIPNDDEPRGAFRVAVPVSTFALLVLTVPLLFAVLLGMFTHSTVSALPDIQPSPTATFQPLLTVMPQVESTPTATATVKAGSGGGGGGGGRPSPTATPQPAPTATPVPTAVPTPPLGGG